MRRRLTIAIVGTVLVSLVVAGLGTILLASLNNRRATEDELRDQAEALAAIFEEVTLIGRPEDGETQRERLARLTQTLRLEGVGLLLIPRGGAAPIGELPPGIEPADIDGEALRVNGSVSGTKGDLVYAAAGGPTPAGLTQVIVLTSDPAAVTAPAWGWFIIAAAGALALSVLVAVRVSRRISRPVDHASSTARRIAGGDLAARVPESEMEVGGEIAELVGSINTMAANLDRSRSLERQFLLSVSHDLRTPLTSIRGYAEALQDGAVSDVSGVGAVIEQESARLERLVGDLLLLARLESTGFEYDIGSHDAREIVEDRANGFERESGERDLELSVRVPDEPTAVLVDPDRYAQVVGNLVANACRFAATTVAVTLWRAEGRIHLAVADDGPGIPEADLPHVFERLYVSSQDPKATERGSGLGLAIVRELVSGMDGTVVARRSALGGAEFVVSFRPAPRSS